MGVLPSAVGPEPIVRLQAGGLKVAEVLRHDAGTWTDEIGVTSMSADPHAPGPPGGARRDVRSALEGLAESFDVVR